MITTEFDVTLRNGLLPLQHPSRVEPLQEIERFRLTNGMRVVLAPIAGASELHLSISVPAGARYEPPEKQGVHHLIDHLLLNCTQNYPNILSLNRELIRGGGIFNASIGREVGDVTCSIVPDYAEHACRMLSELFFRPLFTVDTFKTEKRVIIQEMTSSHESPDEIAGNLMHRILFGSHRFAHVVGGTQHSLTKVTLDDTIANFQEYYHPSRAVLTICGAIPPGMQYMIPWFFDVEPNTLPMTLQTDPIVYSHKRSRFRDIDFAQSVIRVAYPLFNFSKEVDPASMIVHFALGGTPCSRLFTQIRSMRGLCYEISSWFMVYSDCAYLQIHCETEPKSVHQVKDLIHKVAQNFVEHGIDQEELDLLRSYYRGRIILNAQKPQYIADRIAFQELFHGPDGYSNAYQRLHQLERVTIDDVNAAACEILKEDEARVVTVGKNLHNLDAIPIATR